MHLKMDVAGIDVYLKINNYRTLTEEDEWDCRWCKCDFSFSSGCWLNYHKSGDEVLLSSEVEEMTDRLTKLLNDEIAEPERIRFVEPDFVFKLHPKRDMRKDGDHIWIRPGCEIADIYVEWEIYFWHEGLTDNHLTITLGREEIIQLREYLIAIIN